MNTTELVRKINRTREAYMQQAGVARAIHDQYIASDGHITDATIKQASEVREAKGRLMNELGTLSDKWMQATAEDRAAAAELYQASSKQAATLWGMVTESQAASLRTAATKHKQAALDDPSAIAGSIWREATGTAPDPTDTAYQSFVIALTAAAAAETARPRIPTPTGVSIQPDGKCSDLLDGVCYKL